MPFGMTCGVGDRLKCPVSAWKYAVSKRGCATYVVLFSACCTASQASVMAKLFGKPGDSAARKAAGVLLGKSKTDSPHTPPQEEKKRNISPRTLWETQSINSAVLRGQANVPLWDDNNAGSSVFGVLSVGVTASEKLRTIAGRRTEVKRLEQGEFPPQPKTNETVEVIGSAAVITSRPSSPHAKESLAPKVDVPLPAKEHNPIQLRSKKEKHRVVLSVKVGSGTTIPADSGVKQSGRRKSRGNNAAPAHHTVARQVQAKGMKPLEEGFADKEILGSHTARPSTTLTSSRRMPPTSGRGPGLRSRTRLQSTLSSRASTAATSTPRRVFTRESAVRLYKNVSSCWQCFRLPPMP